PGRDLGRQRIVGAERQAHLGGADLVRGSADAADRQRDGSQDGDLHDPLLVRNRASAGISNVSDAHELSQSAFENHPASIMWTALISHTPSCGSGKVNAPRSSVRVVSFTSGLLCAIASTS